MADVSFAYGVPKSDWAPLVGCWPSILPGPSGGGPKANTPATIDVTNLNFPAAFQLGHDLGIGSVAMEGPAAAEAGSYGTWTIVFTAGPAGVASGGGLRIGLRHTNSIWSTVQNTDPRTDGFVSVQTPGGPVRAMVGLENSSTYSDAYFPFQNMLEVTLGSAGLQPGQTIRVTYGDRSGGSRGYLLQPFTESHYCFQAFADVWGNGAYLPVDNSPTLRITAAAAARLTTIARSDATAGQPISVLVRAEDRFGNPAEYYDFAHRVAGLDFAAVADHDILMSGSVWAAQK